MELGKKTFTLVVNRLKSEKSGKFYNLASLDLGYRTFPVSFKDSDIAELMGISVPQLYEIIQKGGVK